MKILNFGSCNIDYVYTMDHIVRPGETTEAEKLCKYPGGKGLNQSIVCSCTFRRKGLSCRLRGKR